jgi:hypothetical protein
MTYFHSRQTIDSTVKLHAGQSRSQKVRVPRNLNTGPHYFTNLQTEKESAYSLTGGSGNIIQAFVVIPSNRAIHPGLDYYTSCITRYFIRILSNDTHVGQGSNVL